MNYPIRTLGRTIEVCKYRVDYPVELPLEEEGGEPMTETSSRLFTNSASAERFSARVNGTVVEVDTTAYDWLDGLTIQEDAACYMDAALAIAEIGQAAYEAKQTAAAESDPVQTRADVDYLALMMGVNL